MACPTWKNIYTLLCQVPDNDGLLLGDRGNDALVSHEEWRDFFVRSSVGSTLFDGSRVDTFSLETDGSFDAVGQV